MDNRQQKNQTPTARIANVGQDSMADSAQRPSKLVGIVLGSIGLMTGLAAHVLATGMLGGGHGWLSAVRISWIAIVAGPLAALTWVTRYRIHGMVIGGALSAVMLGAHVVLLVMTEEEGFHNFFHVWSVAWPYMLWWCLAWGYWQILLVSALCAAITHQWRERKSKDHRS